MIWMLSRSWTELVSSIEMQSRTLIWLATATTAMIGAEIFVGVGFSGLIRLFDDRRTLLPAVRLHFVTSPARLMPGLVGNALGRAVVGAREGIETKALWAASAIEPALSAAIAILSMVTFLPRPSLELLRSVSVPRWLVLVGAAGVAAAVCALVVYIVRYTERFQARAAWHARGVAAGSYVGAWMFFGVGAWLTFRALGISAPPVGVCVAAFAGSWLAGFVALVVPAGLGVREFAMVHLLSPWNGESEALAIALVSRFVWLLATAAIYILGLLWKRLDDRSKQLIREAVD